MVNIIPILQMRKLGLREVRQLAQSHPAWRGQNKDRDLVKL